MPLSTKIEDLHVSRLFWTVVLSASSLLSSVKAMVVCTPDNPTVVCPPEYSRGDGSCDGQEFWNCRVDCQGQQGAGSSCRSAIFYNSTVFCARASCDEGSFVESAVTCHDHSCDLSHFQYSSITCAGTDSCDDSTFDSSIVACSGSKSCNRWIVAAGALFTNSTVHCSGSGSCTDASFVNSHVTCQASDEAAGACSRSHFNASVAVCNTQSVGYACNHASLDACACCIGRDCTVGATQCGDAIAIELCTHQDASSGRACSAHNTGFCDSYFPFTRQPTSVPTSAPVPTQSPEPVTDPPSGNSSFKAFNSSNNTIGGLGVVLIAIAVLAAVLLAACLVRWTSKRAAQKRKQAITDEGRTRRANVERALHATTTTGQAATTTTTITPMVSAHVLPMMEHNGDVVEMSHPPPKNPDYVPSANLVEP